MGGWGQECIILTTRVANTRVLSELVEPQVLLELYHQAHDGERARESGLVFCG